MSYLSTVKGPEAVGDDVTQGLLGVGPDAREAEPARVFLQEILPHFPRTRIFPDDQAARRHGSVGVDDEEPLPRPAPRDLSAREILRNPVENIIRGEDRSASLFEFPQTPEDFAVKLLTLCAPGWNETGKLYDFPLDRVLSFAGPA